MGGRHAIFLAALVASASPAVAQSVGTVYGFGDSYADTNTPGDPGGVRRLFGQLPESLSTPQGRFSSGLNFVDRLQANFAAGDAVNYAFGGAMTDGNNVTGVPGAGFTQQWQLVASNPDDTFGPDDIVALSIGGNNANAILGGGIPLPPGEDAAAAFGAGYAQLSAAQMGQGVQALVDRGARTISYFSVGLAEFYPSRTGDENGPFSPEEVAATEAYLRTYLEASQTQMAGIAAQGVRVNFFNFAELQRRIFQGQEAQRFGFTAVTDVPNPVFGELGVPTSAQVPCPNLGCNVTASVGHFYWDSVHLTEEAYNLAADFMTIQLVQNETIPVQAELAQIQSRTFTDTLHQRMQARRDGAAGFEMSYSAKDGGDPKRLSYKDAPEAHVDDVFALFVAGGFGGGERDARDGIVGYDYDLRHIVVGGEWKADEHVYLGAAVGYSNAQAEYGFLRGQGETELDSVNFGVYASLAYPNWFADLALAYSINSYDLSRTGFVSPFGEAIALDTSADMDGSSFAADFRTGYLFRSGALGFGPIAGLSYAHVSVDGYTESGDSLLTMTVEDQELNSLIGSIGVQVRYSAGGIEPYVAVTVEKEFMDDWSYNFALTSASVVVNSIDVGGDSDPFGRVRAGVKAQLTDQLTGSIDGNATFGRDIGDDYAITGSLKYQF
jgi:outer membrane lipase/esterase